MGKRGGKIVKLEPGEARAAGESHKRRSGKSVAKIAG